AGENVGAYAIGQGTLSLSSNYVLTYVGDVFTISTRAVTVTADAGQGKVYGDADPAAYTYSITSGALYFGDTFGGALDRVAGENVGAYAIGQGTLSLSSNYVLTYVGDVFTISTRAVTVTADAGQGKVYGDADPAAYTYSITSGALYFGDTLGGGFDLGAGENVGAYAIGQGTLSLSSNYVLTYVGDVFTISTRAVTVTADAGQGKVYGDADPAAYTYSITSGALYFGDTFGGALDRVAGENVGAYAIGQGTLSLSSNYVLTYVGDVFTIS